MISPTVECRVPTYRRPELLRRSLNSLLQQSFPNWKAVVMDDSPSAEGREVVESIDDPRITYQKNPKQLGAAMNIDHAFSPEPILGGKFAFVLEDDNAIDSKFIEVGIQRMERGDIFILSFNQRCIYINQKNEEITGGLLRNDFAESVWTWDDLRVHAFLGLSLPNGGYFWKLGLDINLSVGAGVLEPQLQECVRQTKIKVPIALMAQPFSLWSNLPPNQIRRELVGNRKLAANLNQLSAAIVDGIGTGALLKSAALTRTGEELLRARRTLGDLSLISPLCFKWFLRRPVSSLRCKFRYHIYSDSLGQSLQHLGSREYGIY